MTTSLYSSIQGCNKKEISKLTSLYSYIWFQQKIDKDNNHKKPSFLGNDYFAVWIIPNFAAGDALVEILSLTNIF